MCSDCEDEDPICGYCGDSCYGACPDPDACRACWSPVNTYWEDWDGELGFQCIDEECSCRCHEVEFDDLGIYYESGVRKYIDVHGPPYQRLGTFPFLKLPGELRDKVYDFAFLQDGDQRRLSANHRGAIHTAFLLTCRQVYKEAGHLPLSINTLCFNCPLLALNFLGFSLAPTKRHLLKGMHIEYSIEEFGVSSWQLLMRQLVKMPITHLGLTIMGLYPKEALLDHDCFTHRFQGLKGLKSFDLVLATAEISEKDKKHIIETMRERLIEGYVRPKEGKSSKNKRAATGDGDIKSKGPTKKVKKGDARTQKKMVGRPKPSRVSQKSRKAGHQAIEAAAEAGIERARQFLLDQYNQLMQYAISIDFEAAPVKIRLEEARKAAETLDELKFEKLAYGIFLTLEERYNNISAARKNAAQFEPPVTAPEHSSS